MNNQESAFTETSSTIQFFPPGRNLHRNNFMKLDDAEIYYEVKGDGPPIIFIHGLGGNHLSWWQQIPHFVDRYKCINFSHRGFSLSTNHSNKIGHEVFADDLSQLIEMLNLKDVYIVAQSMGGWTALTYFLKNVSNVKAVVMASTSGTIDFKKINHPQIEKLGEWENWSGEEMKRLKNAEVLNAIGFEMAKTQPALSLNYEQIYNLTPYSYKETIRTDIKSNRIQSPDVLNEVDTPFLFITGENDVSFPAIGGEAMASVMKNAKWINFKNTGHSVYFERADEFNKSVDEFISIISNISVKKD
ncbi:MAG: alpha/beta hydrolase [Melioribacteraceae bacterium]|nr:alpha/beta hydrolase [Melioribacteraceae bacterium]